MKTYIRGLEQSELLITGCSATETSWIIDFLCVASTVIVLSSERKAKALTSLRSAQAGLRLCCSHATQLGFLAARPNYYIS